MNKRTLIPLVGIVVAGLLGSCTKKYDKINTSVTAIATVGPTEVPFLFTKAESAAPNSQYNYQVAQNLFADQYAQYFACVATYFPSDRLTIRQDWVSAAFNPMYTDVMPQLLTIFKNTDSASAEHAIAEIWWVYTFHRVTDYWGPIPYFSAGSPVTSIPYDPQDKIYADFFRRLDEALTVLTPLAGTTAFGGAQDIVFAGSVDKWRKFGASLRLRLALRVSKVDPALAKLNAEAAVASGVMEASPTDDALVSRTLKGNDGNGLSVMSPWDEFRMSATMESVLKGYSDPRLPVYFDPAKNTGTYEGVRNGLTAEQLGKPLNDKPANSHVGPRWSDKAAGGSDDYLTTPQNVMGSGESWFNRAEGALNGWTMGGTAKELYEKGIAASMNQWGITDATAITAYTASSATPVAPNDFLNSPAVSTVPIAWSGAETTQRLQIATQKWLAIFPDGMEAWADYRRSHILPLYPVANSDNALITNTSTQWIRRIPFLDGEKLANGKAVNDAVSLLGGEDNVLTPLWWDKN